MSTSYIRLKDKARLFEEAKLTPEEVASYASMRPRKLIASNAGRPKNIIKLLKKRVEQHA